MFNDLDELTNFRIELSQISEIRSAEEVQAWLHDLKSTYLTHEVELQIPNTDFQENLTCFEYALDLDKSRKYLEKKQKLEAYGICCNSFFMAWLARKLHEVNKCDVKGGEIILYKKRHGLKPYLQHAGKVISKSKINSKWGKGHVYEHPKLEVPLEYGKSVDFFLKPDLIEVENYFDEFLKEIASQINDFINDATKNRGN